MVTVGILRHHGIATAIITGRESSITAFRAQELGITYLHQKSRDKVASLQQILDAASLTVDQVLFMGDDTPDIPVLKLVGFAACPQDAMPAVKPFCHYVSPWMAAKAPCGMF